MTRSNLLPTPVTSTERLTWMPGQRQYVGDISSTNGLGRAYADACDEGLTLTNPATGGEVRFVVDRTDVRDGEVVGWLLVPEPGHRYADQVRALSVVLFND